MVFPHDTTEINWKMEDFSEDLVWWSVPGRRGTAISRDKQTHGVAFADEGKSQGIQQVMICMTFRTMLAIRVLGGAAPWE